MLYKVQETLNQSVNAEFLAETIKRVFQVIEQRKVVAIVTDNASEMLSAQRIMSSRYPGMIGVRCSAHRLNLLIKDIAKLNKIDRALRNERFIIDEIKKLEE